MSLANLLPRSTRESFYTAVAGQTVFGATQWLAFDVLDVDVRVRQSDDALWEVPAIAFVVSLSAPRAGFVTVTFATGLPAGMQVRLQGRRVHGRITDVTRGGAIVTAALERELDMQAAVLQEQRRDIDGVADVLSSIEHTMADAVTDTAASVALAREWAEKPYDTPISNEPAGRSALHWSQEAHQAASLAATYAGMVGAVIYDFGLLEDTISGEEDWGVL